LHRMQRLTIGETFDGENVGAVGLHGEDRAALHRFTVDVNGARAARRRVATDVGAGEPRVLADEMHEQRSRLDVMGHRCPADLHRYLHGSSPKVAAEPKGAVPHSWPAGG